MCAFKISFSLLRTKYATETESAQLLNKFEPDFVPLLNQAKNA